MPKLNYVATALTGASYVLSVPNRVRFSYTGTNKQAVAHRFVLYWVYGATGEDMNDTQNNRLDYLRKGQYIPVGLGMTNESGELIPIKCVPGLSLGDANLIDNIDRRVKFQRPLYTDRQSLTEQERKCLLVDTQEPRGVKHSVRAFGASRQTAFMLLPVDNIHLTDYESLDLVELGKHSPMVWKGLIDQPNKRIELPCPIMEWDQRLQNAMTLLRDAQQRHASLIQPHVEQISKLMNLSQYVRIMECFPYDSADTGRLRASTLIDTINDLQATVVAEYIDNTNTDTACGKSLATIEEHGQTLWQLVQQPELHQEIRRHVSHQVAQRSNPTDHESSPDAVVLTDWQRIYETLQQAYALLNSCSEGLRDDIYRQHIKPCGNYMESLVGKETSVEAIVANNVLNDLPLPSPPTQAELDTPILGSFLESMKLTPSVLGNSPGPASLMVGILNFYGMHQAKKIKDIPSKFQRDRALRAIIGMMRLFNMGEPIKIAHVRSLVEAVHAGDLDAGRQALIDHFVAGATSNKAVIAGRVFKGAMAMFTFAALIQTSVSNQQDFVSKWADMIGHSANLGLMASSQLSKAISWVPYEALVKQLGVTAYGAGIIVGSISAVDAWRRGDDIGAYVNAASALTSLIGLAGYLGVFGRSSALGMLVGSFGMFVAAAVLILRELSRADSERTFSVLLQQFDRGENDITLGLYSDNDLISHKLNAIKIQQNRLQWWRLSWRAVIPLYEQGFRVLRRYGLRSDLKESAALIAGIVMAKNHTSRLTHRSNKGIKTEEEEILDMLRQYENEKYYADRGDVAAQARLLDWQHGTIYPLKGPAPLIYKVQL